MCSILTFLTVEGRGSAGEAHDLFSYRFFYSDLEEGSTPPRTHVILSHILEGGRFRREGT